MSATKPIALLLAGLGARGILGCAEPPRPPPARPAEVAIDLSPAPADPAAAPGAPAAPAPSPEQAASDDSTPSGGDVVFAAPSLPPGGVHAVDPLALLPKARQLAGLGDDARLTSLVVTRVAATGLVDLSPPSGDPPRIEYRFAARAPAKDAGASAGAPTRLDDEEPVATLVVDAAGLHAPAAGAAPRATKKPLPDPRCAPKRVWDAALRAGAPKDAVAVLTYDESAPGVWTFQVDGSDFKQAVLDATCDVDKHRPRAPPASR